MKYLLEKLKKNNDASSINQAIFFGAILSTLMGLSIFIKIFTILDSTPPERNSLRTIANVRPSVVKSKTQYIKFLDTSAGKESNFYIVNYEFIRKIEFAERNNRFQKYTILVSSHNIEPDIWEVRDGTNSIIIGIEDFSLYYKHSASQSRESIYQLGILFSIMLSLLVCAIACKQK